MNLLTALLALGVERLFGYPRFLQRRIGHPVEWMGWVLQKLEIWLNDPARSARANRWAGIAALSIFLTLANGAALGLARGLDALAFGGAPFGWVLEALLASAFLAQKQLGDMVSAVAHGLGRSLPEGRQAVAHIVGRDTQNLDAAEVSRAAIETLAENASDGVVAPLFWLLVLGLPGIVFYKAVNTADSMIGHRNARFESFGWAAARLDDVLNWIPARLTALLFALGAPLAKASMSKALEAARRDAPRHASPNAGWPEAAMAGALGLGLGGPRAYAGKTLDLPMMGHGRRQLGPKDIAQALRLYNVTLNLIGGTVLLMTMGALLAGAQIY